jgi:hypothetical protein
VFPTLESGEIRLLEKTGIKRVCVVDKILEVLESKGGGEGGLAEGFEQL